jgi:hypothetical protein
MKLNSQSTNLPKERKISNRRIPRFLRRSRDAHRNATDDIIKTVSSIAQEELSFISTATYLIMKRFQNVWRAHENDERRPKAK